MIKCICLWSLHSILSCFAITYILPDFSFSSSSRRVEAAPAPRALQQQRPLLQSARSTNPTQPNPRQMLPLRPNLSLQLPALPNPNLSLHQLLLRTQLRKLPPHLEPRQPPAPQHQFQTGSHRPSLSLPGLQEVRTPGLTQQSGQRA